MNGFPENLTRTPINVGDIYRGSSKVVVSKNIHEIDFDDIYNIDNAEEYRGVNADAFENFDNFRWHNNTYYIRNKNEFDEWKAKILKFFPDTECNVFLYYNCGIPCIEIDDPRSEYQKNALYDDIRRFYANTTYFGD